MTSNRRRLACRTVGRLSAANQACVSAPTAEAPSALGGTEQLALRGKHGRQPTRNRLAAFEIGARRPDHIHGSVETGQSMEGRAAGPAIGSGVVRNDGE